MQEVTGSSPVSPTIIASARVVILETHLVLGKRVSAR